MKSHIRVVITGLGAVTPIGNNVDTSWYNAVHAKSGIQDITRFSTENMNVRIAAEVKNFNASEWLSLKEQRRCSLFIQYAIASAGQALQQSGLSMSTEHPRIGACIGVGIGDLGAIENGSHAMKEGGDRKISPFFIPYTICNMASGIVSQQFKLQGPCFSVNSACASGTHSIGEAVSMIQQGRADAMIAGGAEGALCRLGIVGFDNMHALSRNNTCEASRPFDQDHDGFVFGEGAGIVFLEREDIAKKRGAHILAEVSGYGLSADAWHMTAPPESGSGATASMKMALQNVSHIDYVNAHGTSTQTNDTVETQAILNTFGEKDAYKLSISSTKSVTGHCLGAAGGIEAVFAVKSILSGIIPPTAHLRTPAEGCPLDYTPLVAREKKIRHVLSNSFGFGGTNASLVFSAV
ncbi:MAG: beta-ketoacyl-ACP synthase II [Oligoflexales bacterium]